MKQREIQGAALLAYRWRKGPGAREPWECSSRSAKGRKRIVSSQTVQKEGSPGKNWISAQENPFHTSSLQSSEDSRTENLLFSHAMFMTLLEQPQESSTLTHQRTDRKHIAIHNTGGKSRLSPQSTAPFRVQSSGFRDRAESSDCAHHSLPLRSSVVHVLRGL